MQTPEDFLQTYPLRRALLVFLGAQLIGTVLALGWAARAPALAALPGVGTELLRGVPALLIILVVWLQARARSISATQGLTQIISCIRAVDLMAIVGFNLAVGIGSILVILSGLTLWSPASIPEALATTPPPLLSLLIAALASTTLAPLSEEIVFRGWLFQALKRRMPVWPAILLSSLAFTAIHPALSAVNSFLFGVCAAIAYFKTRNLWVSIVIHALNNLLISMASLLEYALIRSGLVHPNIALVDQMLILGLPCLLVAVLLGRYLVVNKSFFNVERALIE